jgi:hypothetical protein
MRMLKRPVSAGACAFLAGAVAAAALALAGRAFASGDESRVEYKFQYYHDNDAVDVLSNVVGFKLKLGEHLRVGGEYLVDAITSASRSDIKGQPTTVDGVTSATGGGGGRPAVDGVTSASSTSEYRNQVGLDLGLVFDFIKRMRSDKNSDDPTTITVSGSNSQENDYTSRTLGVGLSQDLFQRNTTIAFTWGRSYDQYQPAARFVPGPTDEGWNYTGSSYCGEGRRLTDRWSAILTQGLTTTTGISIIGSYVLDRGYLNRPYYVIEVGDAFYHDQAPPERTMMSVTGKLSQYVPMLKGCALHLDYRFYDDDWAVQSHTAALAFSMRVVEHFVVEPSYRFYRQSAAFFYQDRYPSPMHYMTSDPKLGTFYTHSAGLRLSYELADLVKPDDRPFFTLFPVSIDLSGNYLFRQSTADAAVRDKNYERYPLQYGYNSFWVQAGATFVF